MKIGDRVTWESSALGCTKTKTGTVLAIVNAGQEIMCLLPLRCRKKSHSKISNDVSKYDRLLVKVLGGAKGNIAYYYAPIASKVRLCDENAV